MSERVVKIAWMSWIIFASMCGIATIAGGTAFGLVQIYSGDNAVWAVHDPRTLDNQILTPITVIKTKVRGRYGYVFDAQRHEICPGAIVTSFASRGTGIPAVITVRRPAVLMEPKLYEDIRVDNELPENVTAGSWDVVVSVNSRCLNREQVDPVVQFRLEVTP